MHRNEKCSSCSRCNDFYLEFVLIISIVVLALAVILQGRSLSQILPSLSLFLFASLRLLPSANRIIASLQTMRFTKPGVDLVYNEFHSFRAAARQVSAGSKQLTQIKDSISLRNIDFTYPSAQRKSLDGISLDIGKGSVVGVIGQSGSGKTTLVNILTGLLQPDSGQLMVDGLDITDSVHLLQQFIGYVPQNIFLVDDTLEKILLLAYRTKK
jgi:ABC-type bacteriocin/lantibiotic exporter with double-glycine peptidase domain